MRPTYPGKRTRHRSQRASAAALALDRAVFEIARRWLLAINGDLLCWLALAALAPVLLTHGYDLRARLIYAVNRPFCHQRDDRSFHLLGEKMACCQRCTAIYGGFVLFSVAYVALNGLRPLSWRWAGLLSVPILLDGLSQTLGLRESTWALRVATGGLFAVGLAWLVLPHLETGFAEMRAQLERRFARLVAQGQTRPLRDAPPMPPA